jgi:hypothetical protein
LQTSQLPTRAHRPFLVQSAEDTLSRISTLGGVEGYVIIDNQVIWAA